MDRLRRLGIKIDNNLLISDCAHLVLPYHRLLDEQRELRKGHVKIGTTKRGIGPAYGDKAARTGLRISDLMQPILFSKKLQAKIRENNSILAALGAEPISFREVNEMLYNVGREFGASTGRARRCGWFDAVATRYACMINGIDELAVTNLDGLDTVDPIRVCVAYRLSGKRLDVPPCDAAQLNNCEPIYAELPGWRKSTHSARKFSQLPAAAKD